ncbi:MAG TPA: universal stress protein, partial [bacterium]|nr:universal stress protein [bacterium]HPP12592.1 universal stress protein [bacterium]
MPIENIAVCVAGDPAGSLPTAKFGIYLAKCLGARLTAIHVIDEKALQELLRSHILVRVEALEYEREMESQAKSFLERFRQAAEARGVIFQAVLRRGIPHQEVTKAIKEFGAQLLVMGELKEALSLKERFFDEGSLIFYRCPCPVVVVKDPASVESLYRQLSVGARGFEPRTPALSAQCSA